MSLDAGKIFKSVLLAATMACPVYGVIDIRVLPNEVTPKQVILENDSLYMEIHVNWTPVISSLKYKPPASHLNSRSNP